MPIEMPRGLPFAVDTWAPSSRRRRHRFLTHAHRDHLVSAGSAPGGGTVYATRLTMSLALRHFPQLERGEVVEMEVGKTVVVDDPAGAFSVTAYDANHCPGAVMFLFEGEFGSILHTGDCRLTPDCVQNLQLNCCLDTVFLDCTFSECHLTLPSKESAIQQVIACIWKHPHAPSVYLACDLLGHEEILVEVSRTFDSKIYVDMGTNLDRLSLTEIITDDPSCRFQIVGFKQLKDRASKKLEEASQPAPLFIRPSTQWYACDRNQKPSLTEAEQDDFGVWHICFSFHSSRDELEQALQLLQPQWVISTTPQKGQNFAMELSYVKKRCLAHKAPRTQDHHRAQENVPVSSNFSSIFIEKLVYEDFVQRIPFSGRSPIVVEIDKRWVNHRTFGLSMRVNNSISEHVMNMMGQAIMSKQYLLLRDSFFKHVMHFEIAVFVPLLMRKTWYLVVANFWKKRFEILSPLGYTDELIRQAQSVVRKFREAFDIAYPRSRRVKILEMDGTFHTISNSDKESDSGIFIMKTLDLYDGERQILFKDSDTKGLREHLTFYLLAHEYNKKTPHETKRIIQRHRPCSGRNDKRPDSPRRKRKRPM